MVASRARPTDHTDGASSNPGGAVWGQTRGGSDVRTELFSEQRSECVRYESNGIEGAVSVVVEREIAQLAQRRREAAGWFAVGPSS
jgi:hypothetical protein